MFEFIIMADLKPEAITQRYGQPEKTEVCSNIEIWRYDEPHEIYESLMQDGL